MKNKRRLATVLGFVMVFTMIFSLKTPMNVNAGNVSHVKATAADVRTSANVAAGAHLRVCRARISQMSLVIQYRI